MAGFGVGVGYGNTRRNITAGGSPTFGVSVNHQPGRAQSRGGWQGLARAIADAHGEDHPVPSSGGAGLGPAPAGGFVPHPPATGLSPGLGQYIGGGYTPQPGANTPPSAVLPPRGAALGPVAGGPAPGDLGGDGFGVGNGNVFSGPPIFDASHQPVTVADLQPYAQAGLVPGAAYGAHAFDSGAMPAGEMQHLGFVSMPGPLGSGEPSWQVGPLLQQQWQRAFGGGS